MDSLPPEILCDIFMETLQKPPVSSSRSISAPLRISHVCREWRHLSLSYRELWSYLCINTMTMSPREQELMMVEVFDTWMARSNDGPLNFEIVLKVMESDANVEEHQRAEYILTTLIENQHRWKNMFFFCSGVSFSSRFPGFNLTCLPLLKSLRLLLDQSAFAKADFTNSSRLLQSTIQHNDFNLLADGRLPQLEWVCLNFFLQENETVAPENAESILLGLKLLRSSPFMRYLDITISYSTAILLSRETILHTSLNELSLHGWRGSELPAAIIDVLTLPSLQRLRLNHVGNEKLLRFFQRSTPPLTELSLGLRDSREETLIDILRLLPSLKKLHIYGTELSGWFFRELTVPVGISSSSAAREQIICPILSRFGIGEISSDALCLDSVQTMAKSRSSVFGTLETASFHNKRPYNRRGYPDRTVAVIDLDKYSGYIDPKLGLTLH